MLASASVPNSPAKIRVDFASRVFSTKNQPIACHQEIRLRLAPPVHGDHAGSFSARCLEVKLGAFDNTPLF